MPSSTPVQLHQTGTATDESRSGRDIALSPFLVAARKAASLYAVSLATWHRWV